MHVIFNPLYWVNDYYFIVASWVMADKTWEDGLQAFLTYLRILSDSLDESDVPEGVPTYQKWEFVISSILSQIPRCEWDIRGRSCWYM